MRSAALAAAVAAVAVAVAGCAGTPATSTPATSAAAVYPVPSVTARPDEGILHLPTASEGDTAFTLLGLTTGMDALVGSHAEFEARGQFVRVRMSVVNNGRSSVSFDARKHVLVDDKKVEHAVDAQAMTIKRQPEVLDLGANVRLEYDVYYDLPEDAKPLALRVFGGPTLTDLQDRSSTEILLSQ
ncbi:DUF4352 domain-containing protein [Saccharothrix algeriensis]|uniref:DUF4352 domain-containing protein n=1 Tax=Saccharothrix algeriensis TaxID=173560 RepID=A0A8T8HUJ2_9PSEU|nr:DUF4352 domain-containing protein [Saccharothrix algeriensis]MBM7813738.1 subtilisin family serine protease [Saccharothrix algeriensis]QTR02198.1 DUF4352 domain-containing protein [Saccharothrix algeriensis]